MSLSFSSATTLIPATPSTSSHAPSSSSSAAIFVVHSSQDIITLLCNILSRERLSEEDLSKVRVLINAINDLTPIKQQEAASEAAIYEKICESHPEITIEIPKSVPFNINVQSKAGGTTLTCAAANGYSEVVNLLVEAKANVDTQDKYGRTALACAALKGRPGVVSLLIEAKANVDAPDKDGATALVHATYQGHSEVVSLLIEAKADVDTPDKDGNTALIYAAYHGHFKMAHQFINAGAKLGIINNLGKTALDEAIARSNLAIISLLLAHGAQIRNIEALWNCLCSCDPREPDFLISLQKLGEQLENYLAVTLPASRDASSEIRKTEKLKELLKEATGYLKKLKELSPIEQSKLNARITAATSDMPSELVSLISAYEPPLMRLNVFRLQNIDRVLSRAIEESKPIPTAFFIQEKTTQQRRATLAENLKQFRSREELITLLKDYQTMRGIQSDSFFKGNKDRKLAAVANAIANIENNAPLDPSYTKERNQGMLGAIWRPGRSF